MEQLKAYAVYFGIEGLIIHSCEVVNNILNLCLIPADNGESAINQPVIPQPPQMNPARMFMPGDTVGYILKQSGLPCHLLCKRSL